MEQKPKTIKIMVDGIVIGEIESFDCPEFELKDYQVPELPEFGKFTFEDICISLNRITKDKK